MNPAISINGNGKPMRESLTDRFRALEERLAAKRKRHEEGSKRAHEEIEGFRQSTNNNSTVLEFRAISEDELEEDDEEEDEAQA